MKIEETGLVENIVGDERYQHVLLDVENGRLVATDGNQLGVYTCEPEEGDVSGLISTEALKYARSKLRHTKIPNMIKFRCLAEKIVVQDLANGHEMSFRRPQGEFPKYEQLFPQISGPPTMTLNPYRMMDWIKGQKREEIGKEVASISLWAPQKEGDPIVMKCTPNGAIGILMPVKHMSSVGWNTTLPTRKPQEAPKADAKPAKDNTVEMQPKHRIRAKKAGKRTAA